MDWLRGWLGELLGRLPTLKGEKSPNLAAFLGFVLGGIGLGLYFMSFVDFLVPVAIAIAITLATKALTDADPTVAFLAGALIAALYGAVRAHDSNLRIRAASQESSQISHSEQTPPGTGGD